MDPAKQGGIRIQASVVNPRTGLVKRLTTMLHEPGDPPLVVMGADTGNLRHLAGGDETAGPAGGVGTTWCEAEAATIGEVMERLCAACVDRERLVRAPVGAMEDVVDGWALFTRRQHAHVQHGYARWEDPTVLSWLPAHRIHRDGIMDAEVGFVPAQFVHLPFRMMEAEQPIAPGTSTGLAAGPDLARASISGLHEVIERDAFTLTWLHGAVPPLVRRECLPNDAHALMDYGTLRVFDITSDVRIPTRLAVLEQDTAVGPVRVVGAATRRDPGQAARKAVLEAFQTVPYVRDLVRHEPSWRAGPRFENLRDFRDHARFYTMHPEYRQGIAHLIDGPFEEQTADAGDEKDAPSDPVAAIAEVVDQLERVGLSAYFVRLTTDDVRATGHEVVRVLVPGAQPLHGFYQVPHLDNERFRHADRVLPFLAHPRTEETVNQWPHPFA